MLPDAHIAFKELEACRICGAFTAGMLSCCRPCAWLDTCGPVYQFCSTTSKMKSVWRFAWMQVHCVVLQLPAKLCVARAAARVDHEGGVKPEQAAAVVGRMLAQLQPPSVSEGFSSIMVRRDCCISAVFQHASGHSLCSPVGAANQGYSKVLGLRVEDLHSREEGPRTAGMRPPGMTLIVSKLVSKHSLDAHHHL